MVIVNHSLKRKMVKEGLLTLIINLLIQNDFIIITVNNIRFHNTSIMGI